MPESGDTWLPSEKIASSAAQQAARQIDAASANPPNPALPVLRIAKGASKRATNPTQPASSSDERRKFVGVGLAPVALMAEMNWIA
jgi:hypothetical protein